MRRGRRPPRAARFDAWLFVDAPPERLAVLRILVGGFAVGYLAIRFPVFVSLAERRGQLDGVGPLWWLADPLPSGVVVAWMTGTLLLGILFTVGLLFRVTGPGFAIGVLLATTYRSSWGQLLWLENLMVLQLLVIGFSHSADAWRIRPSVVTRPHEPSDTYGWPIRLAQLVTVTTYVLAGLAKLRIGGLEWMWGDTLRNHIAYSAARLELLGEISSPLAPASVALGGWLRPFSVLAVALELAAPVALLGGRPRTTWVALTWTMHAAIAALMFVVFPFHVWGVAFACFFRVEELPSAIRRRLSRAGQRKMPEVPDCQTGDPAAE